NPHNETPPGQLTQCATTHGKGDRGTVQHWRDPNTGGQACWRHLTAGGPALGAELKGILTCPFWCPDATVATPGRFLGEGCLVGKGKVESRIQAQADVHSASSSPTMIALQGCHACDCRESSARRQPPCWCSWF